MCVYAGISRSPREILVFSVGDMLMSSSVPIFLGQAKVYYIHKVAFFAQSHEKIVWLNIPVYEVLWMNVFHPTDLQHSSIKSGQDSGLRTVLDRHSTTLSSHSVTHSLRPSRPSHCLIWSLTVWPNRPSHCLIRSLTVCGPAGPVTASFGHSQSVAQQAQSLPHLVTHSLWPSKPSHCLAVTQLHNRNYSMQNWDLARNKQLPSI